MTNPEPTESRIYMQCMILLRERLDCVDWLAHTALFVRGEHFFLTELVFLQFRKSLELIALASMAANKTLYATAHAKFREHWKATKILEALEKLNPHFFPKAVKLASRTAQPNGRHRVHYDVMKENVFTRDDFIKLYDASSDVLHTRNPFSERPQAVDVLYPVAQWVQRIRNLVRVHTIIVNDKAYLVHVPDQGNVQVQTAVSDPSVK